MGIRVAIAGGGTGGHLFPALAVAEGFQRKDPRAQFLFFGTKRGLEAKVLRGEFPFFPLTVSPLMGRGIPGALAGVVALPAAFRESFRGLSRFSPHLVLGVGGYSSGPLLAAAILMGVPTAIQEQNLLPGATNRILGRFVTRVFLSFDESCRYFPAGKAVVTGNPVRRAIREGLRGADRRARRAFTVCVLGGSQGAHRINELVIEALEGLRDIAKKLRFIHQTGASDAEWVGKAYRKKGFAAAVAPFIEDMARAYAAAHLVISRAGATTLSELMIAGRAAVLIPYPHAARRHQEANARWMADKGAAEVLMEETLTGQRLAGAIRGYLTDRRALASMEARAKSTARPDAAERIVEECWRIAHV